MSPYVGPEFFQLCGFITSLITPVQLDLNCFDLILLWKRLTVIDVRSHTITSLGQRLHPIEVEAALLQLRRGPTSVNRVWVAPHFCGSRVTIVRIIGGLQRWRRWFCAAATGGGKHC